MRERLSLLGQKLMHNGLLKVLSLGLSLVLFLFVRGDKESVLGVAVDVVSQPDATRVLVSEPVQRIKVTVRGKWSRLRSLASEELDPLRLDLAGVPDGEHFFEEADFRLPPRVRIVAMQPPSAMMRFEPRVSREVKVEAALVGEHDKAVIMKGKTVDPPNVRVSGAKAAVLALDMVRTVPVDIGKRSETTILEVSLASPGKHLMFDPPVKNVRVRLSFEPRIGEKKVDGVPVKVVGETRYRTTVKPASVQLSLSGPLKELEKLESGNILPYVDAEGIDGRPPGTFRRELKLDNLPKGVELIRTKPKVFHVTTEVILEEDAAASDGVRQARESAEGKPRRPKRRAKKAPQTP